jgi:hypothetical protein
MPWIDISVLGGGLIAHYHEHIKVMDSKRAAKYSKLRYTPEYATMQKELHLLGGYGVTGKTFIPPIFHAISQLLKKHGSVSVLDYGSAGGGTMEAVREHLYLPPVVYDKCYDPFVDEFSQDPEAADLVICTDVMEHVEPQSTLAVLDHIQSLTKKVVFFSISLGPALKTLSDGRNAHINLRTAEYWLAQIKLRFVISEANVQKDEVVLIVGQSIEAVREKIRTSNA